MGCWRWVACSQSVTKTERALLQEREGEREIEREGEREIEREGERERQRSEDVDY